MVLICARTWLYCATRLSRVACEFGSATGAAAVRPLKLRRRRRGAGERADRGRSRIIGGRDGDRAGGVDAGLQIVRRQRGIEPVQRRNLAGAGAEGDVGCRAVAGGGDMQHAAAERGCTRRGPWSRGRPELVSVPRAGDHQSWAVPVLSTTGRNRRRGRGCAGDPVDRGEQVAQRSRWSGRACAPVRAMTLPPKFVKAMVLPSTVRLSAVVIAAVNEVVGSWSPERREVADRRLIHGCAGDALACRAGCSPSRR